MAAVDLEEIDPKADAEAGSEYHVLDPRTARPLYADDEKKEPCLLHMLGAQADKVRDITIEVTRRREEREAKRFEEFKAAGKDEKEARKLSASTEDERAQDDSDILAVATTGWTNLQFKTKTKYTPAVGRQMYFQRPWLRSQALRWMVNPANFIRGRGKA